MSFFSKLKSKPRDDPLAALISSAEKGDVNAQGRLATMYLHGRGVEQNYEESAKWYQKAADQGHPVAQNNLGNMCC